MRAGPLTAPLPYRRPGTGSWPRRTRVPATCPRWSSRPIRAYTQMEQATPIGRPVPMMPVTRRATPSDRTMRRPPPGLTCNSLGVTVGRDFDRGNGGASAVVSSRGWEVILGSERVSRRFPSGFSVGYEEDGSRSLWQEYLVIFYCCYDDGKEVWRWMVLKGNFKQMAKLARTWDWRGSDVNLRVKSSYH